MLKKLVQFLLAAAPILAAVALFFLDSQFTSTPAAYAAPLTDTPVSGVITQTTTWGVNGSPYIVSGDIQITPGVTLTIEPGVMVQSNAEGNIWVQGHLSAMGTATQPVTFTSAADSGGNQWEGFFFDGGTARLKHAEVRYAGAQNEGPTPYRRAFMTLQDVLTGEVRIESSRILSGANGTGFEDWGVFATNSNLVISDTLFANTGGLGGGDYPIRVMAADLHRVNLLNNRFENNENNKVLIANGSIAGPATLEAHSGLDGYVFAANLVVPAGITLTVKPGVTIRARDGAGLRVNGHLEAVGTSSQPITFTSAADSGGNQWEGFFFDNGTAYLKHVEVRYAGAQNEGPTPSRRAFMTLQDVLTGEVRIESSRILSGANGTGFEDWGVFATNSNLVISDTLFANTGGLGGGDYPIRVMAADLHRVNLLNNRFENNENNKVLIANGSIAGPATLEAHSGLDGYVFAANLVVPAGITLTVKPGVTIRARDGAGLRVNGHLEAVGTPSQPITFTSNSNTGGNEWEGILFEGGTGHLKYTEVRYGGQNDGVARSLISISNVVTGEVRIESSRIISGASGTTDRGVYATNSNLVISDTLFANLGNGSADYPLWLRAADLHRVTILNNRFDSNANNRIFVNESTSNISESATLYPQQGIEGYHFDAGVTIPAGITLTVKPGAVLLVDDWLLVYGHLAAEGTASQPITITSRQNSGGGDWAGVRFDGGSGLLKHTTVRYGGGFFDSGVARSNLQVFSIAPGRSVRLENSHVTGSSAYGIYVAPAALPQLELVDNQFSDNSLNQIYVDEGILTATVTLPAQVGLSGYALERSLQVSTGITLTIKAGVTVFAVSGDGNLIVQGHLEAVGTPDQPITFTSQSDSGGGQWEGIRFDGGSGYLKHAAVRHGGNFIQLTIPQSNIQLLSVAPGRSVRLENSRIFSSSNYAIYANPTVLPQLELVDNQFGGSLYDQVYFGDGTLTGDVTLPAQTGLAGYTLNQQLTVSTGVTLTLEPGVTMRAASPLYGHLDVQGHLAAIGTPDDPITFTSQADDGPGQWEGVRFNGGSGYLKHSVIRYAGTFIGFGITPSNVQVLSVAPGKTVRIENSRLVGSNNYAIYVPPETLPQLELINNQFSGNFYDQVYFDNGTVTADVTLPAQTGLTGYTLNQRLTVSPGVTLTLEPGVTMRATSGIDGRLQVLGHLAAVGTPDAPITFTSQADTAAGQWEGIGFDGGSGYLKHVTVRYGGSFIGSGIPDSAIHLLNVAPGKTVRLESSRVLSSRARAIYASNVALPQLEIVDTQFSGNTGGDVVLIEDGALSDNLTLAGAQYELQGSLTVPAGITLTVTPGVTLLADTQNSGLVVQGHLEATGSFSRPITFTVDNGTLYWRGIVFDGGSGRLDYATVSKGGGLSAGLAQSNIVVAGVVTGGQVLIENSNIRDSIARGLTVYDGQVNVANTCIYDNPDDGLFVASGGNPLVTIGNSDLRDNAGDGLENQSGITVTATYNWWGHPTGPAHPNNPRGVGQVINDSNDVDYSNFTQLPACSNLLRLSKKAPDTALVNRPITYTLKVTNLSTTTARGLVITDTVPQNANVVNILDGGQLVNSRDISWTVPALPGNSSSTVQFVVTATETLENNAYTVRQDGGGLVRGVIPVRTSVVRGGSGEFEPGQLLASPGNDDTRALALGDLDGDGDLDIFESNGSPNVVWLNDGSGTFSAQQTNVGNDDSQALALGDLNNDGTLDALVGSGNGGGSQVYINQGSGSFNSGANLLSGDSQALALGDLNADGNLDAFVATGGVNEVWFNDGSGQFSADPDQNFDSSDSQAVALGDLNDDGLLDAVVANGSGQDSQVWLNSGTGVFTQSATFASGDDSQALALGDLDRDGNLDAFVANNGSVQVWLGTGSGTFNTGQEFPAGDGKSVALGDLDADGDLDAFVANSSGQANQVWLNNGSGVFTTTAQLLGSESSSAAAIGDLDGDGDLDTLVGNGGSGDTPNQVLFNINRQVLLVDSGGATIEDLQDGLTTTIRIPAGAVSQPTVLTYTSSATTPHPLDGLYYRDRAFSLDAARNNTPITNPFSVPVEVTMHVTPGLTANRVLYWDENGAVWEDVALTCDPKSAYSQVGSIVAVEFCHLTDFGLFLSNSPPLVGEVAPLLIDEARTLTFTVSATDTSPVTGGLSFGLLAAPVGASLNPVSGDFSWLPRELDGPGQVTVTVVVSDSGPGVFTTTRSFSVTVAEVNLPPSLPAIGARDAREGEALTFTITAADPDQPANNLSYGLLNGPPGAVISGSNGLFSWTPAEGQGFQNYTATVVVTDNGTPPLSDTVTFSLTVAVETVTTVSPAGKTITATRDGLTTTIVIPPGAVSGTTQFTYTLLTTITQPLSGSLRFAGQVFDLTASSTFSGVITITITYDPALVNDPARVRLYYLDEDSALWVDAAANCTPPRQPVTGPGYLVTPVCHLTEFALVELANNNNGPQENELFLPAILRD
jgi:uncharacterized repeat protein (TIGR01451 family)